MSEEEKKTEVSEEVQASAPETETPAATEEVSAEAPAAAEETAAPAEASAPEAAAPEAPAEEESVEVSAEPVDAPEEPQFTEDDTYKWYVVRTYSGYEAKAKLALQERIKQNKMEERFREILIPSENVIELVRGEKKTTSRKFFPGYMLVKMDLDDHTWHLVKGTPKVTGFVGNATAPPAIPPDEVAKIATQMQEGTLKPRPKVQFEEGESVRVVDGPFVNFNGVVEEVKPDKGKLRVMVSIFGRSTPVELDFVQVEKN